MILHNIITLLYQPLCWDLIRLFDIRVGFEGNRSFLTHLLHDDISSQKLDNIDAIIELALLDEFPYDEYQT